MECAAFFLWMTQFPVQPYGLRIQALLLQQYKLGISMPQALQTSPLSHRFSKHWGYRAFPMMCQMGVWTEADYSQFSTGFITNEQGELVLSLLLLDS